MKTNTKEEIKKERRIIRSRKKINNPEKRPRFIVYRSNKYIYAQLIDDKTGKTVTGISEKNIEFKEKLSKTEKAKLVGEKFALIVLKGNIKEVVFDRSGYKYHGRVKALAEGARSKGLIF